ncbi:helix-turn-helix domain-containing protein [Reichenbachiella versicolor]|uniref:helix-turn-helix domain-containing protein n=1 Tax=Reichenbachiella versicolor TaxID=1821036 RepID=UPI000D6DFF5B|nr:helix-turn-helix transcriptional regulator [Reichenbachiella versicolor]
MRIDLRHKDFLIAFGKRIEKLRNSKGWSQYELSYKTNIERSSLIKIEKGTINTGVAVLPELAKAFDISIPELLSFDYES